MKNFGSLWELLTLTNIASIYKNQYLEAIRRSFYILIPFWLTVSFFDMLGNIFLEPSGIVMDKDGLNLEFILTGEVGEEAYQNSSLLQVIKIYRNIIAVSYSIIPIVLTITLSRRLSELWDTDKNLTTFCALISFIFVNSLTTNAQESSTDYFSGLGLFSVLLITFAASKLFAVLYKQKRLLIKVSKAFPEEMAHYLSATLSVLLTLTAFSVVTLIIGLLKANVEPLLISFESSTIFQSLIFVMLYQFIVWILWWLGIPGYSITSTIMEIAYIPAQINNQIGESAAIFTSGFFQAGVIHVLGLIIAILVFSQHENWRTISKFSLPLMAFNIQEVFLFGLPIVLNPIFFIPYILAPIANSIVGWMAISWGIVPIFQIDIPWTMPLFFSAVIGTHSVMGGVLQAVWLIMDIFIYAPFVITANSLELTKEKGSDKI